MNINPLKAPDNEASIMEHWKYTDKVYISCVCITYNQENYIKDAVDGMLAQITDYRFEIIIHDDKSTDSTREILLEYKKKYPNLIKLVLQDENQYQKGKKITPLAIAEAIGEYIALCEGDDYWININKIDKQTKIILSNKKIELLIHRSASLTTSRYMQKVWSETDHGTEPQQFDFQDVIIKSGQFSPTASYFFRKKSFLSIQTQYDKSPIGDLALEIYLGHKGIIYYIPDIMSVYRINSNGSWSAETVLNPNKLLKLNYKLKVFFDSLPNEIDVANCASKFNKSLSIRHRHIYKTKSICYLKLGDVSHTYEFISKYISMRYKIKLLDFPLLKNSKVFNNVVFLILKKIMLNKEKI